MKKFLSVILLCFSFLSLSPQAEAKVLTNNEGVVRINEGETIEDDLFVYAETIEIEGDVIGNIFAVGGTINFSGSATGSVFLLGGTTTISGAIGQSVVVGSGNLAFNSSYVYESTLIGAGTVSIDSGSHFLGTVLAGAGTFSNQGEIDKHLFVAGGSVSQNAPVGGEVRLASSKIDLGNETIIAKDLYYLETEDVTINNQATVSGTTHKVTSEMLDSYSKNNLRDSSKVAMQALALGFLAFSYLGALLVGILALYFFRPQVVAVASRVISQPTTVFLRGLVISLAVLPISLVLFLTWIGAPLAILLLTIFFIGLYLSRLVISYALGHLFSQQFGWTKLSPYAVFGIGLTIFYLLTMIPFGGVIFSLIAVCMGLGSIFSFQKNTPR